MRKVFPSDMVAHLWANQSQDEARESGYRMYFEGKIIYSYGSHFPIARIVDGNTILFTSREYSSTTSKHKHTVRCAIDRSRYMVFTVDNVLADYKATHKENYKKLLNEYNYLLEKASKARSRANMFLHDADVMRTMLNDYSKYFKLGYKSIELPADLNTVAERIKQQQRAQQKKKQLEEKRLLKLAEPVIRDWQENKPILEENYKNGYEAIRAFNALNKIYLRLDSDRIITIRGAQITIATAKRLWHFMQAHKQATNSYAWSNTEGRSFTLDHFRLNSIDAKGNIKAGCHFIEFDQLEFIAKKLGLAA